MIYPLNLSQRKTVQQLCEEMRANAGLWILDQQGYGDGLWSREETIIIAASEADVLSCSIRPAEYIKQLRNSVKATRRSQAQVFADIRDLGFTVSKIEGEYRISRPLRLHATPAQRERAEAQAAYCSDLAEALATAKHWASSLEQERTDRAQRLEASKARAAASQPSPEAVAQLITVARAARFALESAIYLQGIKALIPTALQLIDALDPFEADIERAAEAQMIAAFLSGRPDLAA